MEGNTGCAASTPGAGIAIVLFLYFAVLGSLINQLELWRFRTGAWTSNR